MFLFPQFEGWSHNYFLSLLRDAYVLVSFPCLKAGDVHVSLIL